jgi:two-component system OmpR family sensor kinase
VLEGVQRRFERRAGEQGREIVVAGEGLTVEADRLHLDQVVGSVVDNAVRYGAGTITISSSRAADSVSITVIDEGPGFPADFLDRAFERFSRASSRRSDGGSGLGLSIVRTVVRAHGGEATATNRPGGGGEVTITIANGPLRSVTATPG